jgi:aspartate/methionine/tyrosine aminotransferase
MAKWERFPTSIFTEMSQRSLSAQAINLSQGFPDGQGPQEIIDAATSALAEGFNQYAPSAGIMPLRETISDQVSSRFGMRFCPEKEVTIYSGATEGIFCAFQGFLNPGEEAITFAPFYDSYPAAAHAAGCYLKSCPLKPFSWEFDWQRFASLINDKTRLIMLNTPHNPTGKVFTEAELRFIGDLAIKHDLLIITDEVYEEIIFDNHRHIKIAQLDGLRERTYTISSTAKTFSVTGFKIGYGYGPKALTDIVRKVHQYTVFCSATPLQYAMLKAFALPETYYHDLRSEYEARRDLLVKILKDAGFRAATPEGAYFVLGDFSSLSKLDDCEFSNWLTQHIGVSCIPISVFYDDPVATRKEQQIVRFAFCKSQEVLKDAAERLQKITKADQ